MLCHQGVRLLLRLRAAPLQQLALQRGRSSASGGDDDLSGGGGGVGGGPAVHPQRVVAGATSVEIPRGVVEATFTRSSGAGGQNVNCVSSRAQLRLRLASRGAAAWLDAHTRARLASLNAGALTREGDLLVVSQRHRTQEANLDDAMDKLRRMVLAAAAVPVARALDDSLSGRAKAARTEDKRRRASVKAARRGGGGGDD